MIGLVIIDPGHHDGGGIIELVRGIFDEFHAGLTRQVDVKKHQVKIAGGQAVSGLFAVSSQHAGMTFVVQHLAEQSKAQFIWARCTGS